MKKIKLKNLISPLAALIIITLIFVLIASASAGDPFNATSSEVITPIDIVIDNSNPDSMQIVAQNDRFVLKANMMKAVIRLEDKTGGTVWTSSPEGYEDNLEIKGAAKVGLGSILNIRFADRDSNTTTQNAVAGSVNRNSMNAVKIDGGVRFDFYFEKEGFLIPLEITLEESGIVSRVPVQEIQEASNAIRLISVIPLPNFGAGAAGEDGYLLVPDGSGALITFEKDLSADYSQRVYGKDRSVVDKTSTEVPGVARLPVFGIKKGDQAFLSIITQGASRTAINGTVSSSRSPYFLLEAEFIYRESTVVDVSQKTFEFTKVNMFEPEHSMVESFEVQYRILDKTHADYTGMANAYRSYLINEKGMKPIAEKRAPLYIGLLGGVMRQESVLGFPVRKVVPITSYNDVVELTGRFLDNGIGEIVYNYASWSKGGTESVLPVRMATEPGLGSRTEFLSMLDYLDQNDIGIFLDVNLSELSRSIRGYSTRYDSAQSVQREPVLLYKYKMSTFQIDTLARQVFLLNPAKMSKAADAAISSAEKYRFTGFSAGSIGKNIYSDFGTSPIDRGSAEEIWTGVIGDLSAARSRLLLSEANAYAIPYATDLIDTPATTGKYLTQDREIPFYQIAMHGLVSMASTPINGSEDNRTAVLKAVEAGINLNYTFGVRNIGKLAGTASAHMSFIDYGYWFEEAVENYKDVSAYLHEVSDQAIVSHEQIGSGVYRTVFADGTRVLVNYTDHEVIVDETKVEAQDYAVERR
ncbi:MAG: DUF5696 domain-containing protein [Saccharofermentanales bacterium]